jgi:hypothetical protein
MRIGWAVLGFATLLGSPASGDTTSMFTSVDHRGFCRRGTPATDGSTKAGAPREWHLVAHGSEYGHHCGEDQGRFAFMKVSGDFDVAVQVAAIENGEEMHFKGHRTPAKAGLMAREGNAPGDRYVGIFAVSNGALDHYPDSFHFDVRHRPKAWLGSEPKGAFQYGYLNRKGSFFDRRYPNVWVRLTRKGHTFAAFASRDGKTWVATSRPSFEVGLPRTLLVGLALQSAPEGRADARSSATFRNLRGLGKP